MSNDFLRKSEGFGRVTTPLERLQALREAGISLLKNNEEIKECLARIDEHGKIRTPDISRFTTNPKQLFDILAKYHVELTNVVNWAKFVLRHAHELSMPLDDGVEPPASVMEAYATGWNNCADE